MVRTLNPSQQEDQLVTKILELRDDPEAFVMFAFPWGEPGTPLANSKGPRGWQRRALVQMKEHIAKNRNAVMNGTDPELMKMARASGRGIGKSAFLAWISLWLVSTMPSATVMVSANTEGQLKNTTFPEIRKWATLAINAHWWDHAAMSIKPAPWLVEMIKKTTKYDDAYWYIQARLWSEETPDAYAGAHSQMAMAVLFDEASGIASSIWPVAHGFFTDKTIHRFWFAISNPRNPSGAFFDCFHGEGRDSWDTENIDAREVEENDQSLYADIIKQYGEDSDQARVEVFGEFPRQGDTQFIGRGDIDIASRREMSEDNGAPLIIGVDPARFGNDNAVIAFRQGNDARSIQWQVYPKLDLAELARKVAAAIDRYKPDAVAIEGDGVGGGLVDILKDNGYRVIEVKAGGSADDKAQYNNRRTELWGKMRDWIGTRGCIPDTRELIDDLAAPEYEFSLGGQIKLEPKAKIKKRGLASTDRADALATTFAVNISRNDSKLSRKGRRNRVASGLDYNVFG